MSEEKNQPGNPWAQTKTDVPASARLRFTNCRRPQGVDELSAIEKEQLVIAGRRYDGADLPAEARLSPPGGEWDEEESFHGFLTLWDVVDETNTVRCTAWFYQVDTGTIFTRGTTDVVAEVIQCGLECGDATFAGQLHDAARELRKLDPEGAKDMNIIPPK